MSNENGAQSGGNHRDEAPNTQGEALDLCRGEAPNAASTRVPTVSQHMPWG